VLSDAGSIPAASTIKPFEIIRFNGSLFPHFFLPVSFRTWFRSLCGFEPRPPRYYQGEIDSFESILIDDNHDLYIIQTFHGAVYPAILYFDQDVFAQKGAVGGSCHLANIVLK